MLAKQPDRLKTVQFATDNDDENNVDKIPTNNQDFKSSFLHVRRNQQLENNKKNDNGQQNESDPTPLNTNHYKKLSEQLPNNESSVSSPTKTKIPNFDKIQNGAEDGLSSNQQKDATPVGKKGSITPQPSILVNKNKINNQSIQGNTQNQSEDFVFGSVKDSVSKISDDKILQFNNDKYLHPSKQKVKVIKQQFDKSNLNLKYDANCQSMKKFISENFKDLELMDFESENRLILRASSQISQKELAQEFITDSQRIWRFLAENVILRESVLLNKHQIILQNRARDNLLSKEAKRVQEENEQREKFKNQLRQNEQIIFQGQGTGDAANNKTQALLNVEENEYKNALLNLQENMLTFYKENDSRGCINQFEKKFLKMGVVFRPIKLAIFGMRQEDLNERTLFIKSGKYTPRPLSSQSVRSGNQSLQSFNSARKQNKISRKESDAFKESQSDFADLFNRTTTSILRRSISKKPAENTQRKEKPKQNEIKLKKKGEKKERYNQKKVESPTKKLIDDFDQKLNPFDIHQILKWTPDNVRKLRVYLNANKKFENSQVIFNIMLFDKQIQDLQDNFQLMRSIRENENSFNDVILRLKENYTIINTKFEKKFLSLMQEKANKDSQNNKNKQQNEIKTKQIPQNSLYLIPEYQATSNEETNQKSNQKFFKRNLKKNNSQVQGINNLFDKGNLPQINFQKESKMVDQDFQYKLKLPLQNIRNNLIDQSFYQQKSTQNNTLKSFLETDQTKSFSKIKTEPIKNQQLHDNELIFSSFNKKEKQQAHLEKLSMHQSKLTGPEALRIIKSKIEKRGDQALISSRLISSVMKSLDDSPFSQEALTILKLIKPLASDIKKHSKFSEIPHLDPRLEYRDSKSDLNSDINHFMVGQMSAQQSKTYYGKKQFNYEKSQEVFPKQLKMKNHLKQMQNNNSSIPSWRTANSSVVEIINNYNDIIPTSSSVQNSQRTLFQGMKPENQSNLSFYQKTTNLLIRSELNFQADRLSRLKKGEKILNNAIVRAEQMPVGRLSIFSNKNAIEKPITKAPSQESIKQDTSDLFLNSQSAYQNIVPSKQKVHRSARTVSSDLLTKSREFPTLEEMKNVYPRENLAERLEALKKQDNSTIRIPTKKIKKMPSYQVYLQKQ